MMRSNGLAHPQTSSIIYLVFNRYDSELALHFPTVSRCHCSMHQCWHSRAFSLSGSPTKTCCVSSNSRVAITVVRQLKAKLHLEVREVLVLLTSEDKVHTPTDGAETRSPC